MAELSLIAAVAKNGIIGSEGTIPWHLPEDLRYFLKHTHGHVLIMGRRTYESIGRALPGRDNIVISRSLTDLPDAYVVSDLQSALDKANSFEPEKVFVIGGTSVYREVLPVVDYLMLTEIDEVFHGDKVFPGYATRELHKQLELKRSSGNLEVEKGPHKGMRYAFNVYSNIKDVVTGDVDAA